MDIHQILYYLPHRYPFLLIDRVIEIELNKSVTALKNVSMNEPYFAGHFPDKPVMPGVIILEAMAQTAGILAVKSQEDCDPKKVLYFFAGIDNARFKHVVEPGDQLFLQMQIERHRQDVWRFNGVAKVNNHIVCTADIMLAGRKVS